MDEEKVVPAAGSEPTEAVPSIDKAMDYVAEHPLFGPEEAPAEVVPAEPAKPAEEGKQPEAGKEPARSAEPGKEPVAPKEAVAGELAKPGQEIKYTLAAEAVKTVAEIEKLPYFNDATFQKLFTEHKELSTVTNALREITQAGRYTIGDSETLKGTIEDAFTLYDMGNLKVPLSEFMGTMKQNFPEENWKALVAQMAKYAEENGIKAGDSAAFQDPNYLAIKKIERERTAEKTAATERDSEASRVKSYNALESHVKEFLKGQDIDAKELDSETLDYMTVVVSKVGGKKEILDAIAQGKWSEVDRILTEYNNRMVERMNAWSQKQLAKKGDREKKLPTIQPKGAGGGEQEKPKSKVNLADGEERRAEALRQFKTGA